MMQLMELSFLRRITSSGKYISVVDGLRFLAIAMVIIYHLDGFIFRELNHTYLDAKTVYSWWHALCLRGYFGVELFFVISGFILALPFTEYYLNQGSKISIRSYFVRRLTRLEPPYIISLIIIFWVYVFVIQTKSYDDLAPSFLSSLFYAHTLIYDRSILPLVSTVIWSLEIEVQFYILAPLLFYVYFKKINDRRINLIFLTLFISNCSKILKPDFYSLYEYFHFFLLGILLADYYISKERIKILEQWIQLSGSFMVGFISFVMIILTDITYIESKVGILKMGLSTVQLMFLFIFFYNVLFRAGPVRFYSNAIVTSIGGMCYSIYLFHNEIINGIGFYLIKHPFSSYFILDYSIISIILCVSILILSTIFYILVERPCMNKRWPMLLWKKLSSLFDVIK